MKRLLWIIILPALAVRSAGCSTAGSAAQAKAFDNITAAATETAKSVRDLQTGILARAIEDRETAMNALATEILKVAAVNRDDQAASAQRVADRLRALLGRLDEDERRAKLAADIAGDNLSYIQDVAKKGRDFEFYRASIEQQWRDYLGALALARQVRSATTGGATIILPAPATTQGANP